MAAPRFQNNDAAWPTQFIRGRAFISGKKTNLNDSSAVSEILRGDLIASGSSLGGGSGGMIKRLTARALATTTGGRLYIFSSVDRGASLNLYATALLPAYDSTQTTAIVPADFGATETAPFRLAAFESWWAATAFDLAGGIMFQAEGDGFEV